MEKYTTEQASQILGVSKERLVQLKNGRNSRRNGRVEWSALPLLDSTDWEQVVENGRTKTYFFESAIEKIRAKIAGG